MDCQTLLMLSMPLSAPLQRPSAVGSVDSDVRPIRCHYERSQHASLCDEAVSGLEQAWALQVDGLGWPEPLMDSDGILDVYVSSEGEGGAYAYGPWEDAEVIDGRMVSPAYIVIDPAFETWFYWTMLHEFNHVLQYSIDATESRYVAWEGTATAVESWSDPSLLPMDDYIKDFQATPWVGLLGDGWMLWDDYDRYSLYEYGAALWLFHLDAMLGGETGQAGVDLWLTGSNASWDNEPDFVDALGTIAGAWVDAWMDFSVARVDVGTPRAPGWAESYSAPGFGIALERSVSATELPVAVTPEFMPYQTGAVYVEVSGLSPGDQIEVVADGDAGVRWAVFATSGERKEWHDRESAQFTAQSESAVVGVVNLGPIGFDADDPLVASDVNVRIRGLDPDSAVDKKPRSSGCSCSAVYSPWRHSLFGLLALLLAGMARRKKR